MALTWDTLPDEEKWQVRTAFNLGLAQEEVEARIRRHPSARLQLETLLRALQECDENAQWLIESHDMLRPANLATGLDINGDEMIYLKPQEPSTYLIMLTAVHQAVTTYEPDPAKLAHRQRKHSNHYAFDALRKIWVRYDLPVTRGIHPTDEPKRYPEFQQFVADALLDLPSGIIDDDVARGTARSLIADYLKRNPKTRRSRK